MKLKYFYFIIIILTITSCWSIVEPGNEYTSYTPVLMTRLQLENSVLWGAPRTPLRPGKIYYKDNYIFINEKFKGVHVIDNKNPKSPQNIGFIQAPGNADIAIKANSMYLDNGVDLIAVDITNFEKLTVTERIKDVFPELTPPGQSHIPSKFSQNNRPTNTIIVGWEKQ